jgi:large conductance mechanosensitive channel
MKGRSRRTPAFCFWFFVGFYADLAIVLPNRKFMSLISEFKQFAMRGNVIDLAIGVIIGASFEKIISSLIGDVITPLILKPALEAANLTNLQDLTMLGSVKYGVFLSATINFILVAFVLFLVVKAVNASKKAEEAAAPPPPPAQEVLLTEIRDLLKK